MQLEPQVQRSRFAATEELHAATAIYTREPVVDELLDHLTWPHGTRRLLEPSCGDGAFLLAALTRLLKVEPGLDTEALHARLEAWEVHPGAAQEAGTRTANLLVEHGWTWPEAAHAARRIIHTADFLTEGPEVPAYDVVAGNPPYLRYANVPTLLRVEYEAVVPAHARADLLHSFLDRCARVLRPGGEVGFVTADRWLFNKNAATLREVLGRRFGLHHHERLDPATSFYRPKQRKAGTPPRIHPVAVVLRTPSPGSTPLGAEPIFPDGGAPARVEGPLLGDVAEVRLAPWLGGKGIFVVNSTTAESLPCDVLVPVVDTEEIKGGVLHELRRYAIRTRPDAEPDANVMAHLDRLLPLMAPRGRRTPRWLPPESWHDWPLDEPRLIVPRIAKTLKPVRIPEGVLPINHNLSIVSAKTATLDELEAHLNSRGADAWVRAHAPRLEGGYYSLTTTLLRRLPMDTEGSLC